VYSCKNIFSADLNKKILSSLFLLFVFVLNAQVEKYSLIVVHIDPSGGANFKQKITSYHFLNGVYQGREDLLSVQGKKDGKDYVRTDIGTNVIYKNRYVVTGIGNIIDLRDKKVVFDQKANLVRLANDSAVYYTNDVFKGKFYSVYNFKTNQYSEVKSLLFKAMEGHDIEFDKSTVPYKLNFYPNDKRFQLMADAGYGQTITAEGGRKPDPQVWWANNHEFVFTQFNAANTEVTFVKVNLTTRANSVVGKGIIKQQNLVGFFTEINPTLATYMFGDKKFLIDLSKNSVTELQFTYPEDGFAIECKNQPYGHIIKLNDKEIGKYHFQLKNMRTAPNIMGLVKELTVGADSYQQGLAVWNNNKPGWEKVDAEDVITLIGWIKD
jgi:hypothetical protein